MKYLRTGTITQEKYINADLRHYLNTHQFPYYWHFSGRSNIYTLGCSDITFIYQDFDEFMYDRMIIMRLPKGERKVFKICNHPLSPHGIK